MIPSDLSPLWISLRTSACATVAAFVLGIAAAYLMSRYHGRGKGVIDGVFLLPLVLPPTVVGFFLLLMFGRRSAIGHALEQIGLTIAFSWPATVITATVIAFPLMYRTTLGAFEQVNPNLLGAARTLGASEWRTFRRVLLPLAWPGVIAGTVLAFARALGEFGATLMLAGNIPGRTQTMPVAIFFAAEGGDTGRAAAWVILIVALSLAAIAAMNHWSRPRLRFRLGAGPIVPDTMAVTRMAPLPESGNGGELIVDVRTARTSFPLSVSFAIKGAVLGLLGASGSGKTMTLRLIAGLDTPGEGSIVLNGRVLFDSWKRVSLRPADRRIGMVFQDYALFPHLTARDNIAFGLSRRPAEERQRLVAQWAKVLQIEPLLDRYPSQLSGGQRQRVALARALVLEPEALLLDEPFSALDPHLRRHLEEQLKEILRHYRGVTIFVTHDRDEAYRFCQELVVLAAGEVAVTGSKREIFERPRSLAVARLTGCKNFSRLTQTGLNEIRAEDWNCTLRVTGQVPVGTAYVGIRAHHLQLRSRQMAEGDNVFPCWLAGSVESPFEVTVYLRLHASPAEGDPAHVEAEVSREQWMELARQPQPWQVQLEPEKLLLLGP
ncbi:MAG TPA: molybdate ABC transporter permease subunit [Bryobacteraceae bacterium]|nr:molybdate ABC transporter permease subunit [Bryobacteraceae bacterium]